MGVHVFGLLWGFVCARTCLEPVFVRATPRTLLRDPAFWPMCGLSLLLSQLPVPLDMALH